MKIFVSAFIELVVYVCISGFISNIAGYLVPREKINAYHFPYKSFLWEKDGQIYDKLNVRKWKNKVPDMSKYLDSLYPKSISSRPTASQMDRLIKESCVAEFIHVMLIASSPLCYLSIDSGYSMFFTVLYILGNVPYIIIQRYNRPSFKRIYNALLKIRQGGESCENTDIVMQHRSGT